MDGNLETVQPADIKIFEMNDCDWYAAATVEEALRAMADTLCFPATPEGIAAMREEHGVAEPVALDADALSSLQFRDEDDEDCDEDGPKFRVISFQQRLDELIAAGESFPCFFASSEF